MTICGQCYRAPILTQVSASKVLAWDRSLPTVVSTHSAAVPIGGVPQEMDAAIGLTIAEAVLPLNEWH